LICPEENNRNRLSPAAVKGLLRVATHWKLRDEDTRDLLGGMFQRHFLRHERPRFENSGRRPAHPKFPFDRNLIKALNILYSPKLADAWIKLPNANSMFGGDSPLN